MPFIDRTSAGRLLGERLLDYFFMDPVVLAVPRGGLPVAYQVAQAIGAPLDVIVVRKLGLPFQPELAMGSIGEDGVRVIDTEIVSAVGATDEEIRAVEAQERTELERQIQVLRSQSPRVSLVGRTALVVDDGIATGSTARAACLVARARGATRVVIAVPVASGQAATRLRDVADEVIALETPDPFYAVGQWYLEFDHTSDEAMTALISDSRRPERRVAGASWTGSHRVDGPVKPALRDEDISVGPPALHLRGHLTIPDNPRAMVVMGNAAGSARHSPRHRFIAASLNQSGLATLLFDLLTPLEEVERAYIFDIGLLGNRLAAVTKRLSDEPGARGLGIGYFGIDSGAAGALDASVHGQVDIGALVSLGGQPDLAGPCLSMVTVPTLLLVGERDATVLAHNRHAQSALTCENRLTVIPRATHLFEEPGALQEASDLAIGWFTQHLDPESAPP